MGGLLISDLVGAMEGGEVDGIGQVWMRRTTETLWCRMTVMQ